MKPVGTPVLQVVSGSRSTGTHREDSDTDLLGIFAFPTNDILSFPISRHSNTYHGKVGEEEHDTTWWELSHAFNILLRGNFNSLPLFFSPEVLFTDTHGKTIRESAKYFISQKVVESMLGYATKETKRFEEGRKVKNSNLYKALACVYRELCLADRLLTTELKDFNIQLDRTEVYTFNQIKDKKHEDSHYLSLLKGYIDIVQKNLDKYDGWLPKEPDYEAARQILIGIRRNVSHDEISSLWSKVEVGVS